MKTGSQEAYRKFSGVSGWSPIFAWHEIIHRRGNFRAGAAFPRLASHPASGGCSPAAGSDPAGSPPKMRLKCLSALFFGQDFAVAKKYHLALLTGEQPRSFRDFTALSRLEGFIMGTSGQTEAKPQQDDP